MAVRNNAKFVVDIFASKVSLLILGSLTVWLGYAAAKEAYRKHQAQREIDVLKAEILGLEQRNSNLSSLIDSFEDPRNIELEAKRRLNLKKPGEEVAVILRDKDIKEQDAARRAYNDDDNDNDNDDDYDGGANGLLANALKWWQYITSGNK